MSDLQNTVGNEQEIEELKKDKMRLEWVIGNGKIPTKTDDGMWAVKICGAYFYPERDSPRAAIDAAIESEGESNGSFKRSHE